MARVSPNSPHPQIIRDPDQAMEDDDTSTPHASSFDSSSRAITVTSNPGSVVHSPISCSHSAQLRVEKNQSRSNSRQRARNTTNQMELLNQQIGLAFQHISSSINQSQDENLIALGALSEDARAQYTNLQLFRVRYGADGAPEKAGPRPFSPPRPAQRPGAGCLFRHSLPLCPLRPPPHPYPGRVPVKNVW